MYGDIDTLLLDLIFHSLEQYFHSFIRRLLQMGVCNSEVFTNLGLCCFYAQQFDLAIVCFERALALASDDVKADVWYNISHIALVNNSTNFL